MSTRFGSAFIALTLLSACAYLSTIHSETSIDVGQSFLLGGGQAGGFEATVRNTGPVPVSVLVERAGSRQPVIVLAPDSTIEAELQPREMAVFENRSTNRATIKVDIRGGGAGNLGMRYEPTRAYR